MKVAFQGVRGAYSELAAIGYFKGQDIQVFPKEQFSEVFKAVLSKKWTSVLFQ